MKVAEFSFKCPCCEQILQSQSEWIGQQTQCPHCGETIDIAPDYHVPKEPPQSNTKTCPFCGETILKVAKKCKHCGEFLVPQPQKQVITHKTNNVVISGVDPFAQYHTAIQGKKKGRITVVGIAGLLMGTILIVASFGPLLTPGYEEGGLAMILVGAFFAIGCFCWARKSDE